DGAVEAMSIDARRQTLYEDVVARPRATIGFPGQDEPTRHLGRDGGSHPLRGAHAVDLGLGTDPAPVSGELLREDVIGAAGLPVLPGDHEASVRSQRHAAHGLVAGGGGVYLEFRTDRIRRGVKPLAKG